MAKKHFRWRHYHKISFVYFVLFLMIFLLIDYYAWMAIGVWWIVGASVVCGWIAGYIHIKKRWHDNIDEIAEEFL